MSPPPRPFENLSPDEILRLERCLTRFEDAWRCGERPSLDDSLRGAGRLQQALLRELVRLDLEYRLLAGEPVRVEEYLHRYPELASDGAVILDLIATEYEHRSRSSRPSASEYQRRFPELHCELPTLILGHSTQPSEAPVCRKGRRLGRYVLLEVIGRGSFGIVYKALDSELRRTVALKVPHGHRLDEAEFLREARSAALLRHPGIVTVYDAGQVEGTWYLVSEFVPGQTLAERLRGGRPTYREAAEWMAAIAEALAYAHRQGLTHRDVKPSNILLDAEGRQRLTDFGLARCAADENNASEEGHILGTPAYMAPEQAEGRTHAIGPASDIHALGAVLYELLTGKPPFHGETIAETLEKVRTHQPPPPEELQADVPAELQSICLRCLAKNPTERYGSAEALAQDLRRFLASPSVQAPSPSAPQRFRPRLSRPAAILLVALALMAGMFLWINPWRAGRTRDGSADKSASGQHPQRAASAGNGLRAELFQGLNFERPIKTRIDGPIDWIWGLGPPDPDMQPDYFTIRWTGWLKAPRPGLYKLITRSDDGVRLWLDGRLLIDEWRRQGVRRYEAEVNLTDRPHSLRMEYLEHRSMALIGLRWEQKGGFPEQIVPREALFLDREEAEKARVRLPATSPERNGLRAEWFRGRNFQRRIASRIDPHVDWMSHAGLPGSAPPRDLAIRWTGWLKPRREGRYNLVALTGGGGVRLWLDDQLLIDQWHTHIASRHPATVHLDRRPHPLRIEFFKNPAYHEHNYISFRWEEIGRGQEHVVPTHALFHDEAAVLGRD